MNEVIITRPNNKTVIVDMNKPKLQWLRCLFGFHSDRYFIECCKQCSWCNAHRKVAHFVPIVFGEYIYY